MQVRAVIVDNMGSRAEGDWSQTGEICTTRDAPLPPHSLRVTDDKYPIAQPQTETRTFVSRRELTWSTVDDICDFVFAITKHIISSEGVPSEPISLETSSNRLPLADLLPGVQYTFQVCFQRARTKKLSCSPSDRLEVCLGTVSPFGSASVHSACRRSIDCRRTDC